MSTDERTKVGMSGDVLARHSQDELVLMVVSITEQRLTS